MEMKKIFGLILVVLLFSGCSSSIEGDTESVTSEPSTSVSEESTSEAPAAKEVSESILSDEDPDEYMGVIGDTMDQFSQLMYDFSSLTSDASNDPSLMFTDDWKIDVAMNLVLMQGLIDDVQAQSPPAAFKDTHRYLLLAMDEYQFVVDNFPEALDNMDSDLIIKCTESIENGTQYIDDATQSVPSAYDL
jgi:hypothetical protein